MTVVTHYSNITELRFRRAVNECRRFFPNLLANETSGAPAFHIAFEKVDSAESP